MVCRTGLTSEERFHFHFSKLKCLSSSVLFLRRGNGSKFKVLEAFHCLLQMREQGQLSQTAGGQIISLFKELILKDNSPSNLCIFMNPKIRFNTDFTVMPQDLQRKN